MAEDKEKARPPIAAPSLLSASTAARGEEEPSRILAALEGRAPEAEVKHLAARRDSRAGRWTALALLLALLAGGTAWILLEDGAAPLVAQAPDPATAPAAVPSGPLLQASLPSAAPAAPSAAPPAVASIVDEAPPARDTGLGRGEPEPEGAPTNPLSALAMTAPASAAAAAPGPTSQAAEQHGAARAARPAKAPPRKAKPADTDAALLSALMDYGLPPASPPGTRVYKSEGVFMRVMPGSPLAERLKECEKLSFIEGQQCRLRVCAGQWGTAAECPTPQAHVEP